MVIRRGWTLIEMLVAVSVVAILLGLMLPSLTQARRLAMKTKCMANLRSLEMAHRVYISDNEGSMLGTSHNASWIQVLREYEPALLLRSPLDTSPHFEGGTPIDDVYRQTSYALNYWLSPDNPHGFRVVNEVVRPSDTVHYVIKVFEGPKAAADHVHPHLWFSPIPGASVGKAAAEIQINTYDGAPASPKAVSGYGFLDGHVEARAFESVYRDPQNNSFDPLASSRERAGGNPRK